MSTLIIPTVTFNNLSDNVLHEPTWEAFSSFLDFCTIFIFPIILAFGFFGNCLSIIIFWKKRNQDSSSAGYLGPLAVTDLCNICMGISYWFSNGGLVLYQYATSRLGCIVYSTLWYYFQYVSGWIIVAFSVERCLVVWSPIRMRTLLTSKIRQRIIACILAGAPIFLICNEQMPTTYYSDGVVEMKDCFFLEDASIVIVWLTIVIQFGVAMVIPSLCVAIMNIFI